MATPATHPDPAPLSYGRRAPLHRRRWVRWCVCVALFTAVCAASWLAWQRYGVPWLRERERLREVRREQARKLAMQREWMTYREPPDRVVYAERLDMPERLRAGTFRSREAIGGPVGELPPARKTWPLGSDGHSAGAPRIGFPGLSSSWYDGAVLFMHHRRTRAGRDFILLLEVSGGQSEVHRGSPDARIVRICRFEWGLINPGTPTRDPTPAGFGGWELPPLRRPATATPGDGVWELVPGRELQGPFKFYAGQPDPEDPAHFTVGYTYDGEPGTIDGYVEDGPSGRPPTIRLAVRDGPAADAPSATPRP